jgi:signal transduction histidine kinase
MNNETDDIFNMVLASTVHDMKNSLGMLGESLNQIVAQIDPQSLDEKAQANYGIVQYEASRVNNSLMQLLALYKLENEQLPFCPNYCNLSDFLEEQMIKHSVLLNARGIECSVDVDEELEGVFDESLVETVLENIIGNAIRYTQSKIQITCRQEEFTVIEVADDGPGYPSAMIELAGSYMQGINQSTGSTGLGLFFAQKIANLHSHNNRRGRISLSNSGELGGGKFELLLP